MDPFKLPPADNRSRLIVRVQTAKDIAQLLCVAEKESRADSEKLKQFFKHKDQYKSCELIWWFLRNNFRYIKESSKNQTCKTIRRYWQDRYGDCKHYSIFAVCVLNALKIPCFFRLVAQEKGKRQPNHVYAVAIVNGKEIIIDACIDNFNKEARGYYYYNVAPFK
jgi:hypothetical protein